MSVGGVGRMSKSYVFYHSGVEHRTDNLAQFCKDNHLQRRHMHELIQGLRKSHKGWSMQAPDGTTETDDYIPMLRQTAEGMLAAGDTTRDWEGLLLDADRLTRKKPLMTTAGEHDRLLATYPVEMQDAIDNGLFARYNEDASS